MSDLDLIYGTKPKPSPPPAVKDTPRERKGTTPRTAAPQPKKTNSLFRPHVNPSITRSGNPPVNQSINPPVNTAQVLAKPKGFYITSKQDEDLDEAVKKLGKKLEAKVMIKIDRSTVLRLVLEEANLTSDGTVDRLSHQLISRLINQLTHK